MTLYIFELAFQRHKACSNPSPKTLDMAFLVNVVWTKFQTRLQTRLSGILVSRARPDWLADEVADEAL